MASQPFRGKIYDDITQTIGHTPLLRLRRVVGDVRATVVAKKAFLIMVAPTERPDLRESM